MPSLSTQLHKYFMLHLGNKYFQKKSGQVMVAVLAFPCTGLIDLALSEYIEFKHMERSIGSVPKLTLDIFVLFLSLTLLHCYSSEWKQFYIFLLQIVAQEGCKIITDPHIVGLLTHGLQASITTQSVCRIRLGSKFSPAGSPGISGAGFVPLRTKHVRKAGL